ncbi:cystatin C (amyloid angiopathy and cerebral hemorrhage) [Astyanax mexicanus]|uniref:Cystatin-like n=2 Tax=Astyanax mexicanus TaxID=7994 RepID=A0A8B9HL31_ASTMX|nr:cystatin C (amyloid angiopathy and cerebral hemorrhage) [Astyanax mexicanus]KAG9274806.1 cystatin-like [Astyanax mexicanus]
MFWKVVAPLLALCLAVASAGLVGGPVPADLNEEGVQNALQFAVVQHNKASNDMYIREVSKVISVQKQVVSGLKYIFTVEMARTGCRKGGVEEVCAIELDPNTAQPQTCKFSVWSQPWLNSIKLVENTCQ